MVTRRGFLQQSTFLAAAYVSGMEGLFGAERKLGMQLYTVRDQMEKDPLSTLKQIAAIGYQQVETFLFEYKDGKMWGLTAAELLTALKSSGLSSPSGHYLAASLFLEKDWPEKWKRILEISNALEQEYVVMPWIEEQYRDSIDTYKMLLDALPRAGELCRDNRLKLAYHGHDFEFKKFGETTGYEMLLKGTDHALVNFEIDLCWVTKAGYDPVLLMEKYPGRFPMWHVKGMDNTADKNFTEVGSGIIDFKKIFSLDKLSGMKYFFVEQDFCKGSPFDSLKKSLAYIKDDLLW